MKVGIGSDRSPVTLSDPQEQERTESGWIGSLLATALSFQWCSGRDNSTGRKVVGGAVLENWTRKPIRGIGIVSVEGNYFIPK